MKLRCLREHLDRAAEAKHSSDLLHGQRWPSSARLIATVLHLFNSIYLTLALEAGAKGRGQRETFGKVKLENSLCTSTWQASSREKEQMRDAVVFHTDEYLATCEDVNGWQQYK